MNTARCCAENIKNIENIKYRKYKKYKKKTRKKEGKKEKRGGKGKIQVIHIGESAARIALRESNEGTLKGFVSID